MSSIESDPVAAAGSARLLSCLPPVAVALATSLLEAEGIPCAPWPQELIPEENAGARQDLFVPAAAADLALEVLERAWGPRASWRW